MPACTSSSLKVLPIAIKDCVQETASMLDGHLQGARGYQPHPSGSCFGACRIGDAALE
jgi:hypothetical protein